MQITGTAKPTWSGSPPTGITDVTSQADVEKAVTNIIRVGYPLSQLINANALSPVDFELDENGKIPNPGFGKTFGHMHEVIQNARKVLGDSAINSRLESAIYAMERTRSIRLAAFGQRLPAALQNYVKFRLWNFKVAKLPDGTVDWLTTIGSDPKASDTIKNEIKLFQTESWAQLKLDVPSQAEKSVLNSLKFTKQHATQINNCVRFLSDMKTPCVPI